MRVVVRTGSVIHSARTGGDGAWRSAGSHARGGERSEPLKEEQDRATNRDNDAAS